MCTRLAALYLCLCLMGYDAICFICGKLVHDLIKDCIDPFNIVMSEQQARIQMGMACFYLRNLKEHKLFALLTHTTVKIVLRNHARTYHSE